MSSQLLVTDLDSGETFDFQLVFPRAAASGQRRLPTPKGRARHRLRAAAARQGEERGDWILRFSGSRRSPHCAERPCPGGRLEGRGGRA
jgi:hypothetical protein